VPKFFGLTGPYFGVELEVEVPGSGGEGDYWTDDDDRRHWESCDGYEECGEEDGCYEGGDEGARDRVAEQVYAIAPEHWYLKHDGSLTNGFEIVTHPLNYTEHEWVWGKLFNSPVAEKFNGWRQTCGMHVHVGRELMIGTGGADLVYRKLMVFLNAPENTDFMERVAQRGANTYTAFVPKKVTDEIQNGGRYEALNLTRKTAEFRLFKSTRKFERVMKNLEFVQASIEFCRDASYQELTVAKFLRWLGKTDKVPKKYLAPFLEARWAAARGQLVGKAQCAARGPKPAKLPEKVFSRVRVAGSGE